MDELGSVRANKVWHDETIYQLFQLLVHSLAFFFQSINNWDSRIQVYDLLIDPLVELLHHVVQLPELFSCPMARVLDLLHYTALVSREIFHV